MSWRAIVPSQAVSNLRRCVASILGCHPGAAPSDIIVVDDGASLGWNSGDPAVTWVDGAKPFVYARNVNLGIAAAVPHDVVILGDDCEPMTGRAFDLMAETAVQQNAGVVSAAIDGLVGNGLQAWRGEGDWVIESQQELAFVCVYIPRRVIDRAGTLDERFVWYGGEDVDYAWRVQELGLKLLVDRRVRVGHEKNGQVSTFRSRPDITLQLSLAKQALAEKWGGRHIQAHPESR